MYDDDRDWDNENELAQERATDPDRAEPLTPSR